MINSRIPRPFGLSDLMVKYHETKDPELLGKARDLLIKSWLIGSGTICGQTYSLIELSSFVQCTPGYIQGLMKDLFFSSHLFQIEDREQMLKDLVSQTIAWSLEDRMDIQNQLELLRKSQGDRYAPFISGEVQKILGLKISSSNTILGIVRSLGIGGTNIQINNNQQAEEVRVTPEEVINIIQDTNEKLDSDDSAKLLEANYNLQELPEVVANNQTGIDTSKEALNLNSQELMQITDDYKKALSVADQDHHEMRREIMLNLDTEAEDPEMQ